MPRRSAPVMRDVIEEHLDEAAFLWSQWERALDAPGLSLEQVIAGVERRLQAHLDGLAVAGPEITEQLRAEAAPDEGRAFAAAMVALEAGPRGAALAEALLRADARELRRGAARALALCRAPGIDRALLALTDRPEAPLRAAALDAIGFRRVAIPFPSMRAFLADPDPAVRAAALRAARHVDPPPRGEILSFLADPDPSVRDAAIATGLVVGLAAPIRAARAAVEAAGPAPALPLAVLAASGDPADLDLLAAALAVPSLETAAVRALAASGWPRAADLALPSLEEPRLARLAAEVISCVSGLEIAGPWAAPEPEPSEEPTPFADEDLDVPQVPTDDAALPNPEPLAVAEWWTRERARFDPRRRYVSGRPLDLGAALAALRAAPMRRRSALAWELILRSGGAFPLETRGWARHQLRAVDTVHLSTPPNLGVPLARLLVA